MRGGQGKVAGGTQGGGGKGRKQGEGEEQQESQQQRGLWCAEL